MSLFSSPPFLSLSGSFIFKKYNIIHFSLEVLSCYFNPLILFLVSSDTVVLSISSTKHGTNSLHIGYISLIKNLEPVVKNNISFSLISNTSLENSCVDVSMTSLNYTLIVISLFNGSISDEYRS